MDAGALAVVGPGRAGRALTAALMARGWDVVSVAGRSIDAVRDAATRFDATPVAVESVGRGADLVVLATPDDALGDVATRVAPSLEPGAIVIHLSGASTVAALDPVASARPDVVVGSLHPLQTLPPGSGPGRLTGAWCAIEGPLVELASSLGMHPIVVAPEQRTLYHAAAAVASNHLTAVLGQVQRLAARAGVPFEAFVPLIDAAIDHAIDLGPREALTGPVARGDVVTVAAHLEALPAREWSTYRALARAAATLAGHDEDELLARVDDAIIASGLSGSGGR